MMKIAYILYDNVTLLDFIGIYDPISRLKKTLLPGLEWHTIAYSPQVKDSFGLTILPDKIKEDLSVYDMVFIPGGYGTRPLQENQQFLNWICTTKPSALKTSVCSGSLIWGAAGFLNNRKATSHFDEYEQLASYGCTVLKERIVDDGDLITAGAVSSSLDLGLYLCNKWCGPSAAEQVRIKMDYHPL
jgi:transcriptional regulator GlxA family with amidase domain